MSDEFLNIDSEEAENSADSASPAETKVQPVEHVLPTSLIIMPLMNRPIFPGLTVPLTFSGEENLQAIQYAMKNEDAHIGLVLADSQADEATQHSDLSYRNMGTVFRIFRIMPMANQAIQVLGQSIARFEKQQVTATEPRLRWSVKYHHNSNTKPEPELKAYLMAVSSEIKELLQINAVIKEQVNAVVSQLNFNAPGLTMDLISNFLTSDADKLQELLETLPYTARAEKLLRLIRDELQLAKLQQRINNQIKDKVSDQQKEYFLREQLKAIKKELGIEKEGSETEFEKLQKQLEDKKLTEEAKRVVEEELNKLKVLNPQAPEYNVTRSYLETIASLPWGVHTEENQNVSEARQILDRDHYGLDDVKDAILEFLSTIIRKGKVAGSIILLVGPPGVGKTSIGKSIASAMGRDFFRFSVGGMRDEAEIKGHRRTYIGAMPGKIIQALRRTGTSNPVIMLDEIDKIGSSFRGDPASALLEVLDPEQNSRFLDHYLDIPYDLSNVLFITTANQMDTIPAPLLDRMEVIRLAGYIQKEKVEIAKRYLLPRQLEDHGFEADDMSISDEAMSFIVDNYAREAGVRNLEKQIRKIIRKTSLLLSENKEVDTHIEKDDVEKMLGKPRFTTEKLYDQDVPGVVLGLAYTSLGGATLYIEAIGVQNEKGGFQLTGQLGDVMQESARIGLSYVRAQLCKQKDCAEFFDKNFIHIHVPAGATPKDGPSAGITIALAIYSLATNRPIRKGLAMTGELTLTGRVLPIGGVKEKTIAARRVDVYELIFPEQNRKDFEDLPEHITEGITAHFVSQFSEVLDVAFD